MNLLRSWFLNSALKLLGKTIHPPPPPNFFVMNICREVNAHCGKVSSKEIQIRLGKKCKIADFITGCFRKILLCGILHIHIKALVKIKKQPQNLTFALNFPDNRGRTWFFILYFIITS